jgi:carbonic anhydrase/acetyltransferase-like protein (isoleucine patch superfamily)
MTQRLIRKLLRLYSIAYAALAGVSIGRGTVIRPGARVRRENGGTIVIGDHCTIHPGAMLLSYGGDIRLGSHCSVNPYSVLYGHGGLSIGHYVRIAAHCVLIPANHNYKGARHIAEQGESRRGIFIEDDVWLGAGVRVLDGAKIERGCVVGAGAVVRGVLAHGGVYCGVPAVRVHKRGAAAA